MKDFWNIKKELSDGNDFAVSLRFIGEDILIEVQGGKPHIGCAVMALPRPSLSDSGEGSCTSSVLNVTGHKDEAICRRLAETVAKASGRVVLCTGGVHIDGITGAQMAALKAAVAEAENFFLGKLKISDSDFCQEG